MAKRLAEAADRHMLERKQQLRVKKRRQKLIEEETTGMALKDLEKYHTALDRALMRFHAIKIGEINKIINDLWQIIYRGEDIETIKIHTDVPRS